MAWCAEVTAQTAATEEGGFEVPKVLKTGDFLPPDLIKGKNYTVDEHVTTNGFENTYLITSDHGPFQPLGTDMALIRIQEFAAIAQMEEMKKGEQFATAAKNATKSPLVAAGNLVTNPVDTVTGIPKGVWRYATRVGEMVRGRRGEMEDSVAKELIGFGGAKRKLAGQLGVDAYSSNPVLQRNLNSLAWAAYAGGMTITAGFVAIRAASTVASLSVMGASRVEGLNKMLLDNSPEDLRKLNRQQLAKMGLDGNAIDLFLRNPWFSPRHRTVLVEELAGMEKTKNRKKFITLATTAESEQDAFFFQRVAQLMRGYHETQSPIQEIDLIGGLAVGYAANDALVVPLVVDQGWWSAESAVLAKTLDERAPKDKKKQLWVTGKLSPRLVEELEARKWEVHQDAWATLYPAPATAQQKTSKKN
jgi:hypothetical protein